MESILLEDNRTSGIRKKLRIWLVDDSDNFRVLMADLLDGEADLEVTQQFSSAEQTIEALTREPAPDVILLDIRMRGMSGLEAIRPIRALASDTRVLLLTTFYDGAAKSQALHDGASNILLKTSPIEKLIEEIHQTPPQANDLLSTIHPSFSERPKGRAPELNHGETCSGQMKEIDSKKGQSDRSWRSASSSLARGLSRLCRTLTESLAAPSPGSVNPRPKLDVH